VNDQQQQYDEPDEEKPEQQAFAKPRLISPLGMGTRIQRKDGPEKRGCHTSGRADILRKFLRENAPTKAQALLINEIAAATGLKVADIRNSMSSVIGRGIQRTGKCKQYRYYAFDE
jgi:hypothetical protein